MNCSGIVKHPLRRVELYVVVESGVKSLDFVLHPLLPLVQNLQHPEHDLMVGVVVSLESLENRDDDSSDCRDDGSENQRPVRIHLRRRARTRDKPLVRRRGRVAASRGRPQELSRRK